jgi:hypothetical protein
MKTKLLHPVFIVCLILLILNDWVLKAAFHNFITGKLSDFSGLFALPFLLSSLAPRQIKWIHCFVAALFIAWKTPLFEPIIKWLNDYQIPVYRVVDYTDYIALPMVWMSYRIFQNTNAIQVKRIFAYPIVAITMLACMATSLPRPITKAYTDINKTYSIQLMKRDVVNILNRLSAEDVGKSWGGEFDAKANTIVVDGWASGNIAFLYDYRDVLSGDTLHTSIVNAEVIITDKGNFTELKLLTLRCSTKPSSKKDFTKKLIKQFERKIIKRLK